MFILRCVRFAIKMIELCLDNESSFGPESQISIVLNLTTINVYNFRLENARLYKYYYKDNQANLYLRIVVSMR